MRVSMAKRLKNSRFLKEGLIKRIRGTCYASKASINMIGRMINSARAVFNDYIPDVWIYSEYSKGAKASRDPGYGLCVHAESTAENLVCVDKCFDHFGDVETNSPEEIGRIAALRLVDEVMNCGVVDTSFQSFVLFLMVLAGPKPSQVKLGRISSYT